VADPHRPLAWFILMGDFQRVQPRAIMRIA
jgi:hypothetical protein